MYDEDHLSVDRFQHLYDKNTKSTVSYSYGFHRIKVAIHRVK